MFYRLLLLLVRVPLFSVASGAVVALAATGQTVFYPIDVSQRSIEFVNTFYSLTRSTGINYPQVALQTNLPSSTTYAQYRYLANSNGIIPYVQSMPRTYSVNGTDYTLYTLLIITYIPPQAQSFPQYIVLPVEQMTELLYFPTSYNKPTSTAPFTTNNSGAFYPYFSVDPKLRAADIASAYYILKNSSSFQRTGLTQIWIQTNVSGPFNPQIPNGLLKNVTDVTVNNSLIKIDYTLPTSQQPQTIFVTPEQVQQVIYVYNYNNP